MFSGNAFVREKSAAFRQLATMLSSGMTLSESLAVLASRIHDARLRAFFARAARETGAGRRFSELVADYPQLFPSLTLAMVEAAEHSGRIEKIFTRLADYHEQEYQVRMMLSRETFYPKVLVAAIILIPLGSRMIVAWIQHGMGAAIVVGLHTLLIVALVAVIPAVALYLVWRSLTRSETGRAAIDDLKLRVPLVGKVIRRSALARFSRALATLYGAGVGMRKALDLAGQATANARLRQIAVTASAKVGSGSGISEALIAGGLNDSMVLSMVKTGEHTGNLEETMDHVASYYEDEAATAVRQMAVAIVPIAVIIGAIVVGSIVVHFYTGLYSGIMNQ